MRFFTAFLAGMLMTMALLRLVDHEIDRALLDVFVAAVMCGLHFSYPVVTKERKS